MNSEDIFFSYTERKQILSGQEPVIQWPYALSLIFVIWFLAYVL